MNQVIMVGNMTGVRGGHDHKKLGREDALHGDARLAAVSYVREREREREKRRR